MEEMNHYLTPPPYHIDPPLYENTHIDKHNMPYDDYFGGYEDNYNNYGGVDDRGRDSYDTLMPPHRSPDSPDFPHNEDAFHRPFSVSFWVRCFRYIPHLNLSFNRVNDTFNPKSPVYQESLGLIGCVPAVLLLYTLLMLLLYLLTRCCDHKSRTRKAITCCKVACVISALVTLGAVGVSVWGSQEVHTGVTSVLHALSRVTAQLITLHTSTDSLTNEVRLNWQPQLSLFHERIQTHEITNMTVRDALLDQLHYMRTNISEVLLINVEDIAAKMRSPVLDELYRRVELVEQIRWASTVTLAALLMLVVLVLMLGAARHSRPTLITFSLISTCLNLKSQLKKDGKNPWGHHQ
ncbi:Tweety [Trinorchestia longiramus]|nr:Tweety [Trinorchestia longiramus]